MFCSNILLGFLLLLACLTEVSKCQSDLTETINVHDSSVKIRTIRSNDDDQSVQYPMSFLTLLENIAKIVWNLLETVVNYILHEPGYTVTDFHKSYPDLSLTTDQFLAKYDYISESHIILTEDEYLLRIFRIIGKAGEPIKSGKPVVLLVHGILGTSDDWLGMGPEYSLGYVLADAGYDVWLFNQRGNYYSRANKRMSPEDEEFWYFSFHEIGVQDLPAVIDYVTLTTRQEKIAYLGYSQGTTVLFVLLSEKPEYNEKIELAILYAPVSYVPHFRSPSLNVIIYVQDSVYDTYKLLAPTLEAFGRESLTTRITRNICLSSSFLQVLCYDIMIYLSSGYDGTELSKETFPVFLNHLPSGMSFNQVKHYGQYISTKTFRQYDYESSAANEKVYGQSEPPSYKLNNTKVPTILVYASNDNLANPADTIELAGLLPNVLLTYHIPLEKFNHFDFIWGRDVKELLYIPTVEWLDHAPK